MSHRHDSPSSDAALVERLHCAMTLIRANHSRHLDQKQLVTHCALHLCALYGITEREARHNALQALAEWQNEQLPAFMDLNHSTSNVVYVRAPGTHEIFAFTASELLTWARQQDSTPTAPATLPH